MQKLIRGISMLRRIGHDLGPYLLLELLMPGGSVLTLLLFLHRRGKLRIFRPSVSIRPLADRLWASSNLSTTTGSER